MLSEKELKILAEKALSFAKGYEAEVMVGAGQNALTRFSESIITQNVASEDIGMSVRLLKDSKMGKASTGNVSDEGIRRCVETAIAAVKVSEKDPDLLPLPDPQEYRKKDNFVQATADFSPESRAAGVKTAVELFRKDDLQAAGIFDNGSGATALANSRGLWAYNKATDSSFSISAMSKDSSGWAQDNDTDVTKLNVAKIAGVAAQKALASRNPDKIDPGEYTVIFEPAAVADFLLFLGWEALNGLALAEGRSCFSGKEGKKVVGKNITLVDDAYHPLTAGVPFDYEGLPRQTVTMIDKGIFKGTVHDRRTAKMMGVCDTGHALPQPDSNGPLPLNIVMSPGDSSLQEMIAGTDKGLLVTHLHYTNILNPITMMLTGMTRDGFFMIEHGKITKGLKNMRFTDSALRVLSNVDALSRELYKTETFWGGGGTIVPAIKVNGFHFTSSTEN